MKASVGGSFRWSHEEAQAWRVAALRDLLRFAAATSPFHRRRMAAVGLDPDGVRSADDLYRLPLMTKSDLREHLAELQTVPPRGTREVFVTSGTTGLPVVFRYSAGDLAHLGHQGGELLRVAGVEEGDLFQLTLPLGAKMWVAGIDFWMSFQAAGAGTVRFGAGDSDGQVQTAAELGADGFFATASFSRRLGLAAVGKRLGVRKLLVVNENVLEEGLGRNELGREIERLWPGVDVRAVYGTTELGFSGAECDAHQGFHTHPEAHWFEVVDPTTGTPLPDGKPGRLVATSLLYRGLPLIRYAIEDVTFLVREPCKCGLTSDRLGPIIGRLDDMLKPKGGVSLYPSAVESLLLAEPGVEDYWFEAYTDEVGCEQLRIHAAPADGVDAGTLTGTIVGRFLARMRFRPEVVVTTAQEVARSVAVDGKRKPQRFHDRRRR